MPSIEDCSRENKYRDISPFAYKITTQNDESVEFRDHDYILLRILKL